MVRVDLLCLGTGKASTHIYHGEPSTGFVVLQDGEPVILLGAGLGIVRSCVHYCNRVPDVIYISHNHSDHTGELPLLLSVEAGKGRRKRVYAEAEVMRRVVEHRLAEYHESIALSNRRLSDLADFVDVHEGAECYLTDVFSIVAHRSQHSERCFGFVLLCAGQQVLGWGADSGYDPQFYAKLSTAPVLVLDARAGGSYDHASFEDVIEYERQTGHTADPRALYVTCYGTQQEAPTMPQSLRIGQTLVLYEDARPPQPSGPPAQPQPASAALQQQHGPPQSTRQQYAQPQQPVAAQRYEEDYAPQPRPTPVPHHPERGRHADPMPSQPQSSSARRSRSARGHGSESRSSSQGPFPRRQDRSAAILGLRQQLRSEQSQGETDRRAYAYALPGQTVARPHSIEKFPSPSPGPKRVFVHNNEDKGAPARMFLVKDVRTLDQFKLRIGEAMNIRPIRALYTTDGYVVRSLSDLASHQEIVAVKHAGAPFDIHDLPAHVSFSGPAQSSSQRRHAG